MSPRDPQPEQNEHDQRTYRLMGEVGRVRAESAQRLCAHQSCDVPNALLDLEEKVEEPEAERDVEVDQIRESHHRETEGEDDVVRPSEDGDQAPERDHRDKAVIVVKRVHTGDHDGDGEAGPHDRVPEERRKKRGPVSLPDHLQRYLDDRIDQSFFLHPLLAEDDHHTDHHDVEREEKDPPVRQRPEPGPPRYGDILGHPLEEGFHRGRVLGYGPLRQIRKDDIGPLVLRRGVVESAAEVGQPCSRQPHRADRAGDERHRVHRDQFRPGEREPGPDRPKERVHDTHEQEEPEQRAGRTEVQGHERPLDHQGGVRDPHAQECGDDNPDEKPSQGESLPTGLRRVRS